MAGNTQYPPQQSKWTAALFGCGGGCGTCLLTCCFPCVTYGRIAEVVDEGKTSCMSQGSIYCLLTMVGASCVLSCLYREKLRSKFGLPSSPCCDCCVHYCCEPCALCQEYQELKNRGLDPARGWNGPPTAPPPRVQM